MSSPYVIYANQAYILPLIVLALGQAGRGVSNSLLFLYFVFGIISLLWFSFVSRHKSVYFDTKIAGIIVVWSALFLSGLASSIYNDAFHLAKKEWLVYLLSATSLIFTLVFVNEVRILNKKALLAILGFLFLVYIYELLICFIEPACIIKKSVSAMTLPMLITFVLPLLGVSMARRMFVQFSLISLFTLLLLIFADSRTEIMMLIVAYAVVFAFGFKRLSVLLITPVIVVLIMLLTSIFLEREPVSFQGGLKEGIYKLSTNRMDIWERAITNPPENQLLGSGINNTLAYLPENKFKDALHNAFLEIWYETGFLGLGLWLLLFIMLLKNIYKVYLSAEGEQRVLYSAYLGSFVAVVVAGLLDKGYGSIYFEFFIFYLGAMLFIMGRDESQLS